MANVGDECGARSPVASGRAILADSDVREEQSVPTVTPTQWDRERGISLEGVATAMDLEDTERGEQQQFDGGA